MTEYTATELAEKAGVQTQAIRWLCKHNWSKLNPPKARKSGSIWLVDKETGDEYIRQKR